MRKWLAWMMLCWGLVVTVAQAEPRDHIRVVLDLSKSMNKNDPGHMAILSTLLLYDLARPNPTQGDSFKVIPFKPDWDWTKAVPVDNAPLIEAQSLNRKPFVDAVKKLPYTAQNTYYYPGIRKAIEDLKAAREGDTKLIVLITDGLPETKTQTDEIALIQKDLLPDIEQADIRLYILAFGKEATAHQDFFDKLTKNGSLGQAFFDSTTGEHLLERMLDLFAASLGYDVDPALPLPGTSSLVLNQQGRLPKAAVVVFSPNAATIPSLKLTPGINTDGYFDERTQGAAYNLTWALSPVAGPYQFASDAKQGTVAVLRPTQVRLSISPSPPHTRADRTMAGKPLPLRVEASTEYGGVPGNVDIKFRPRGPVGPDKKPRWEDYALAPLGTGHSVSGMSGTVYDIQATFRKNDPPNQVYQGSLLVEAKRGAKQVGELAAPHVVDVYPALALAPFPRQLDADPQGATLQQGDKRCQPFELRVNDGDLPENPPYTVIAMLNPKDATVMANALRDTSVTLDGEPLQLEGKPGSTQGLWYQGRALDKDQLTGKPHELCVTIGRPKGIGAGARVELPIHLILAQSPYDDFDVIEPLSLRIKLAPSPVDWGLLLLPALGLLAAALLWYLRDRPSLAPDLAYAIASDTASATLVPQMFRDGPSLAHWLGLVVEKPIHAEGDAQILAWLRPVQGELYQLRLARGTEWRGEAGGPVPSDSNRFMTVAIHRVYRLQTPGGGYLLRLEYR